MKARGKGYWSKAQEAWNSIQPGDVVTSEHIYKLTGATDEMDRRTVSSFLTGKGHEARYVKKLGRTGPRNVHYYQRIRKPEEEPKPKVTFQPPEEVEVRKLNFCPECKKEFNATELGESVLLILKKLETVIAVQGRIQDKLNVQIKELVQEKADMQNHIAKQAEKINNLNNELQKKGTVYDLKKLQEKYNALQKQKGA